MNRITAYRDARNGLILHIVLSGLADTLRNASQPISVVQGNRFDLPCGFAVDCRTYVGSAQVDADGPFLVVFIFHAQTGV